MYTSGGWEGFSFVLIRGQEFKQLRNFCSRDTGSSFGAQSGGFQEPV